MFYFGQDPKNNAKKLNLSILFLSLSVSLSLDSVTNQGSEKTRNTESETAGEKKKTCLHVLFPVVPSPFFFIFLFTFFSFSFLVQSHPLLLRKQQGTLVLLHLPYKNSSSWSCLLSSKCKWVCWKIWSLVDWNGISEPPLIRFFFFCYWFSSGMPFYIDF